MEQPTIPELIRTIASQMETVIERQVEISDTVKETKDKMETVCTRVTVLETQSSLIKGIIAIAFSSIVGGFVWVVEYVRNRT